MPTELGTSWVLSARALCPAPKAGHLVSSGPPPFPRPHPQLPGWECVALVTARVLGSTVRQEGAELACGSQESTHLPSLGLPAPACPPRFEQKPLAELQLLILVVVMIFVGRPPPPRLLLYPQATRVPGCSE